jgi:D-galactarolactone cycloisomerase
MEKMKISSVKAFPISFKVPPGKSVTLGIGRAVKRDSVLVRVETDCGVVGWGEAHHGRCPGAIARLIDTTIRELVLGMDALDVTGVWSKVYRMQLASHGMGAASVMALSAVDIALWDIRGKVTGWPLFKLLGGTFKPISAYAGGISLGWQDPGALAEEALSHISVGYRALKLRGGDTYKRDIERVLAVRSAVGEDVEILVDGNTGCTLEDVRKVMPIYKELNIGWFEEPFPPHDYRSYIEAARLQGVPLAAGENHFTRFEFTRLIEDCAVRFAQPDLSKAGGVTECMRIAAMASAWKISCNPHTSASAINMAVSIHLLASIDNAGYFEGDVTSFNPFRDELGTIPYSLTKDGCVAPLNSPGHGIEVDEQFIACHPLIEGPCYI